MTEHPAAPRADGIRDGFLYGLLGLPLAFVALPLYVLLPDHYARNFGVPLTALGVVLLATRLFDAVIDPLLGRWVDRLHERSPRAVLVFGAVAALLLCIGFSLLFYPRWIVDTNDLRALLGTTAALLLLTYASFSALGIAHQSWGARLGGDALQRGRIVGWREGLGVVGVVLASVLPGTAGLGAMVLAFGLLLIVGWSAWTRAPWPVQATSSSEPASLRLPFRRPAFRALLAVFVVNGIASAIPATLVLFFVQDRLRAPAAMTPLFLASYFLCAALAIPLWLRLVPRWGLARCWLAGMGLSIVVFAWASVLGEGDAMAFIAVCVLSGAALGTDLVLPGALLAGVISQAGDGARAGAYFGWWNVAIKLNLALAAGLALPLLDLAGYAPGTRDPSALHALSFAYCLLPCALKLLAAALLWAFVLRGQRHPTLSKAIS